MVGLLFGTILRLLADWTKIPYSPIVIVLGFIIRASSGDRYDSINQLMDANAYLIKVFLVPALVFGTALKTDWILLRR